MDQLSTLAEAVAAHLAARRETVAIAESSTGGLMSAALLGVAGASTYFLGGAVIYTATARGALLDIGPEDMAGLRPSTEDYAAMLAARMRDRLDATWCLAETGAAGPTGNRYGDPAGHCCLAVCGPADKTATLRTGGGDRRANMQAFAARGLELLRDTIGAKI